MDRHELGSLGVQQKLIGLNWERRIPTRPTMKAKRLIALFYLLLFQFAASGSAVANESAPIPVFVSVLPQKYFVERIGGERVQVSVMVGPGQSPATYEPTPRQMVRLADARVYFRLGVPFEDVWMDRLAAANPDMLIVNCRAGIPLRTINSIDGSPVNGTKVQEQKDPHFWTSPPLAQITAVHIKDALVDLDPAHREQFELNYAQLVEDLETLDRQIRAVLADIAKPKFMVFHPSWGYFADTYGLEQIAIEREGKEPSAKSLANAIDQASADGIKIIFVQEQFSDRTAQAVAYAMGAHVIQVDPLAEDYLKNMRFVANAFADAMRQQ